MNKHDLTNHFDVSYWIKITSPGCSLYEDDQYTMIFPSKSLDNPRNCGWPFLALSRLPCFPLCLGKVEQQQPRLLESMESMMETESMEISSNGAW